jgi:hypothetical protein
MMALIRHVSLLHAWHGDPLYMHVCMLAHANLVCILSSICIIYSQQHVHYAVYSTHVQFIIHILLITSHQDQLGWKLYIYNLVQIVQIHLH